MSTFAAPASATSGLQGYDLEGQRKPRRKKRASDYLSGAMNPGNRRSLARKAAPARAAGIALISRDDGKVLFLRRAEDGDDHPGEWNFPGGGIEDGETEEAAAIRELFEETAIELDDNGTRIKVGKTINNDIEYTTFAQKVDEEFEPRLNGEHSAYRWASLDYPPEPLHPWVRAALPLVKSAAVDLTLKAAGAAHSQEETRKMDNLSLFVQLRKVDAKQRIVYGTAVAEVPDRADEIFDYKSSKPEFEKWSSDIEKATEGKSKGNVRAMHGKVAAGKITDIGFDDERKAIDVAAKIVDDDEWKKVEEGVYTGFSIGGKYIKRWQDGELKRYTAAPSEISLVDLPCVPTATFSLIKVDGSEEMRKFAPTAPVVDQPKEPDHVTNDMIAKRAVEIADKEGGKWSDYMDTARVQLDRELAARKTVEHEEFLRKAEKAKQDAKIAEAAIKAAEEKAAAEEAAKAAAAEQAKSNKDGDWEQVWVHKRLAGKTFTKKADMMLALAELDAQEEAAKRAAALLDLVDELPEVEKTEAQKAAAEAEAAKAAEDEAAKAAAAEAAAKTADGDELVKGPNESDEDFEKRKFDAAERKKDAKSGAAESDGSYPIENKSDLENAIRAYGRSKNKAKTKRHIMSRARALGLTSMLPEDWKAKKAAGGDLEKDASLYGMSDLMNMLACVECLEDRAEAQGYGFGVDLPKDVTDRFGLALVNLGDVVADILDAVLSDIREEERDEALNRAAPTAELLKMGARAAAEKEIEKAKNGEIEKAAATEALTQEIESLKIKNAAEKAAFQKTLDDVTEKLKKRIERLEKQPIAPPPGAFRVVDKTVDTTGEIEKTTGSADEDDLRVRANKARMTRMLGPTR